MSAYSSAALRVPRHPHCRRPELSMGRKQASFFLKISAVISSTYATVIGRKKNCVGTVVNITTSARSGLALSQLVLTALIMLCQTFVFLILTEKHMTDATNKVSQELADAIIVLKPAGFNQTLKPRAAQHQLLQRFRLVIPQSLY